MSALTDPEDDPPLTPPPLPREARDTTDPVPAPTLADVLEAVRGLRQHVDGRFEAIANSMLELREADRRDIEAASTLLSGEIRETRRELMQEISLTRQEVHSRADGIESRIDALRENLFGTAESAMSAHDAIGKLTKVVGATYNVTVNAEPHDEPDERAEAGQ